MGAEIKSLDRIPGPMREPIRKYAERVQELAGANALSLTLFGAIAAGAFDATRHTVGNVLVLQSVDLEMLRRLAEGGVKLGKARIAAPLIMTPQYIKASLDTFPLELIEIAQRRLTLFGEDRFTDLSFEDKDVRHQCERELKVILIGLRQGLLAAAGRKGFLGALEINVGEGLIRTLRGLLWLKGQRDAKPAAEVVADAERITERKLAGIRSALIESGEHGWDQFRALYDDVAALGEIVDAW